MTFNSKVYKAVSKIPRGKVTSYGFIATLIGKPRSARQVGWALMNIPNNLDIPWWRVINSKGFISIKNPNVPKDLQKQLLEKEGIHVSSKYVVDLDKYLWRFSSVGSTLSCPS
jgi:methylated-DNA-protein-cysteine methyltransferase-like protein